MNRREIIAYAITHAPPGVKGGPYTGRMRHVWSLAEARRLERDEAHEKCPRDARVIRIVRARPSEGQEASAVEVLRELVAIDDALHEGRDPSCSRAALAARARRVLAASGPDPMPVVRAAMTYWGTGGTMSDGPLLQAVDAYRKAGGK